MENTNNPQSVADDGKTVAIVSYITIIGWIVALVMNSSAKTSLGAYHLRQSLGLMIVAIGTMIIRVPLMFIPIFGFGVNLALSISLLILWILGLVAAANQEEKPSPFVEELFQKWFEAIGK